MKPTHSGWRSVVSSLALGLLIVVLGPMLLSVGVYLAGHRGASTDPTVLIILAGITLWPSVILAMNAKSVRRVSAHWDLGKIGGNIVLMVTFFTAAFLGIAGTYAVVRLIKQAWLD